MGNKLKIFSFFSGIGLLDLGFEDEDFEIAYANELHVPFLEAYKHARRQMKRQEPIFEYFAGNIVNLFELRKSKKIKEYINELQQKGYLVGFIGGPPCPDFSIAGKNRGKEGKNGKLSLSFIELIIRQKPDFFLYENVKGLWRTKIHREFYDDLKRILKENGYVMTDKLINAIEYGTPQNRERIMLFGLSDKVAIDMNKDFDKKHKTFASEIFDWKKFAKYPGSKAFNYNWPTKSTFNIDSSIPAPKGVPIELTVQHWFEKNNVISHPNSIHYFKPQNGLVRFLRVDEGDDSKKSFKRLHRWRYSPTAAYGNNEVHLHPYKPRRISAAEAMAIQSLPKSFVLPEEMTLTNMFKAIGNGVPYFASRKIAKTIKDFLN